MTWEALTAVGSCLAALAALALSLEVRLRSRPRLRCHFKEAPVAVLSDQDPREFVPETIATSFLVVNSGFRPAVIEDMTCTVALEGGSAELINASTSIYRTLQLPLTVPSDSAEKLEVVWILGETGPPRP